MKKKKAEISRKEQKLAKKEKEEKKTLVRKYISFFEIDGRKNKVCLGNFFMFFYVYSLICLLF